MRFETRATQISYGPPNFRVVCREALRKMSLSLIKICTMFLTRKWTFSICCRHCGGGQSAPNNSVSESKCSLKSKSPTSYPKRRFLTCLTLKNHKSITTYFLLQGLIQVFRGGHRRFLLTLGIRSPRKNVQLHARISDQETGKIHLAIFSIPKPKVWFVSAGCQSQWCISPFPFSFLLARQFLCLFWVKADERERCYHLATLSKFNRSLPLHCHICALENRVWPCYDRQEKGITTLSPITSVPQNSWNDWPSLS